MCKSISSVLSRWRFFVYLTILTTLISYTVYIFNDVIVKYPSWNKNVGILLAEEENKFIKEWGVEMEQRKKRLVYNCRKRYNFVNLVADMRNLLWHKEGHLAFCRNAKAGTSTWLRLFLELSNLTFISESDAHNHAKEYFSFQKDEPIKVGEILLFTVVRHPFTRLVSAYRDKMRKRYKPDIQSQMVKKYRGASENLQKWKILAVELEMDLNQTPTFREFLLYVVDQIEECYSRPSIESCLEAIDVHWMPFHIRCSPCLFPYNVISKVETFNNDFRYIKQKLIQMELERGKNEKRNSSSTKSQAGKLEVKIPNDNFLLRLNSMSIPHPEHKSEGITTEELTRKIWTLISDEEKQKLTNAYLLDFLIFGYDQHEFD